VTKKTITVILLLFSITGLAYSLELHMDGEVRTGVFWRREMNELNVVELEEVRMHHNSDAGPGEGRFRLNMHLVHQNLGVRLRFEQIRWPAHEPARFPIGYIFAYGDFLDNQLRVSVGNLGESPWAPHGPDIWRELDDQVGIRVEITPNAVPGLNFGFVLNEWNGMGYHRELETIQNFLMESVLGVSFSNDLFLARFAWRLDSEMDVYNEHQEGHEFIYRLEARFLSNMVPGLNVFATGLWQAVIGSTFANPAVYNNFFNFEYRHSLFDSSLRFQLRLSEARSHLFDVRLGYFHHVLPFLRVGAYVYYATLFGENRELTTAPFLRVGVEPQIRAVFGNTQISLHYFHQRLFRTGRIGEADVPQTNQWLNLRVQISF